MKCFSCYQEKNRLVLRQSSEMFFVLSRKNSTGFESTFYAGPHPHIARNKSGSLQMVF